MKTLSFKPYVIFNLIGGYSLFFIATCFATQTGCRIPETNRVCPPANLASPANSLICTFPPRDNCSFYEDCLEVRYHCGPEGYPIGYGQKFCSKFSASRKELSTRGQIWMLDTMQCLQIRLVPEATGTTTGVTCASLEEKAFRTHAECYIKAGLCILTPLDWIAIVKIVELKTLFDSVDAFLATLNTEIKCLEAYLFFLGHLTS